MPGQALSTRQPEMSVHERKRRHRKLFWLFWLFGVLALLLLMLAADLLQDRFGDAVALSGPAGCTGTVTKVLLYAAVAFLLDQGLRNFVWDVAYPRLTGTAAPGVLQGAGSAVIYTIATLVVLTSILKLDTGAVLISTGLVAGVLGVAMQNTISVTV